MVQNPHIQPLSSHSLEAGMKAFFQIMEVWQIKPQEASILLGQPSRGTFYSWKRGDVRHLSYDTVCRISYILGIYKALQILFSDPSRADSWVKKPNLSFGGQSALKRMLGGNITDLASVREHLDAVRGGWV